MFFTLSKIIDFILLPISWILISLVVGIWRKNTKLLLLTLGMLLLFTNGFFVNQIYRFYELPQTKLTSKYTYGVVLGGGIIKSPQENPERINVGETADRMLQPILLYKAGIIQKIIITGGDTSIKGLRKDDIHETAQVAKFMRAMGGFAEQDDFCFFAALDEAIVVSCITDQRICTAPNRFHSRVHATSVG
jgi:uncharacterized SAM-binding protein YcdF (DUF218 family)